MLLCQMCNSANASAFEVGDCYICKNNAMKTEEMIAEANNLISKEDVKSFSISTIIPKDWQIKEDDVWDLVLSGKTESMKNMLNRKIVSALRKTSLRYDTDGDCRLIFDYSSGNVTLQRNTLFIFGRYKKLKAGLSQSRWICSKCNGKGCKHCNGKGKNFESIEERIGEPMKKMTQASDYVLHASGREDVDATNTAGRPFVLELKEPKKRGFDLDELKEEIEKSNEVNVDNLKIVRRRFVEVVTESHLDKTYKAEVEFEKEITKEDLKKIENLAGITLLQRTPTRVSHRRADLVRHRKVKEIKVVGSEENKATLIIRAEAGTYIKEFISGDKGRTNPSISSSLSTNAECKKLDVSEIDDKFIKFCL